ncbi:uncharacterized protein N7482_010800 [Penicillium canariense]|uniref:Purine-cytosine permease n=1 Tax=Penicillium canariense TaxID=189055 RepID=A0A9W9HJ65_9EURO|nr:uncharacterized protein N7482_010800 [Penicillium canariense]KAJ5150342.1 hypothetical protein N7482_010800 [Penicillium canariense]
MSTLWNHDVEKRAAEGQPSLFEDHTGSIPASTCEYGNSWYARVQRLAGKINVEQRGIERVPEDERNDRSYWNIGSMWLAANMVVPSFTIGVLGKRLFGMGFVDAALVIVFFNVIAVLTVCFFSIFGAAWGLRRMVLSRFWFGWWGVKLIALFNVLACVGWAAANVIGGAQLINALNPKVPGVAGIVIIAFCTLLAVFFGYRVIHAYEYWSWIPTFIIFLVILGVFAHSGDFINLPMGAGNAELGAVLSYGSTVFGFGTGYTSFAADYTVYQPSNRPRRAALINATAHNGGGNAYQKGYDDAGVGGLLGALLFPRIGGFGQFCIVILALSIVANNCPNIYSVSLTLMVMGQWTRHVPRFIWTVVATGVYVAIAIPGYSHFEAVLENFMHFIGYWLAIYEGIAVTEHIVFRRGFAGYRPEDYDMRDKLPLGIAALVAFCFGVAGMVTGMSQSWYVGPIARSAGGDVGFELGFAFAAVSFAILRTIELKIFQR